MALRKGKMSISVNLKEDTVKILEDIAQKELTSRSAISAKIIEENIDKYIKNDIKKEGIK